MSRVAVAIVSHNTRCLLFSCLQSVIGEAPAVTIVVDNASSDGSIGMVRTEFPQVELLANDVNLGYGAAANQAVASCATEHVLILNGDTVVRPGTLRALAAYLDQHPRVGMTGPRLTNPDGSLQPSCLPFPTQFYLFAEMANLKQLIRWIPFLRQRYLPTWDHSRPRRVPCVLGAALFIRRAAFDAIGGFNPSFFMYSEELDLAYRLARAGWETHFAPVATVVHTGGASTSQYRVEMALQAIRSTDHFYHLHYSRGALIRFRLIVAAIMLARLLRDSLRLIGARPGDERDRLAADVDVWWKAMRMRYRETAREPPLGGAGDTADRLRARLRPGGRGGSDRS